MAAVSRFIEPRPSCGKNSARTMSIASVWISPYTIAYRHEPRSWVQRRTGAIIVYSSVPSQRSTAIVSAIQLKTTER